MTTLTQAMTAALGGLALTAAFASPASAACADLPAKTTTPGRGVIQAAYRSGAVVRIADDDQGGDARASIVGLWQFTFTSKGNANNLPPFNPPDNVPLDAGFAQWHSDGTEIMNSSRDPATSSFCLGAWERSGRSTYELNHFALSWDNSGHLCTPQAPATSCMVGTANIRETVTVSANGNEYHGVVTITQYDNANNPIFTLHGTVVGHRIKP